MSHSISVPHISARADFDIHPGIRYREVTHLYWGRYPVKVTLRNPSINRLRNRSAVHERTNFIERVRRLISPRTRMQNIFHGSPVVFFEEEAEALVFIQQMHKHVREVMRPQEAGGAERMRVNRRARFRQSLYHDLYRFKVTLKTSRKMDTHPADEWFATTYPADELKITLRAKYTRGAVRVMYFNDIKDVVFAKLALGDFIAQIEEVILKSDDLSSENSSESEFGEASDREEGDPSR